MTWAVFSDAFTRGVSDTSMRAPEYHLHRKRGASSSTERCILPVIAASHIGGAPNAKTAAISSAPRQTSTPSATRSPVRPTRRQALRRSEEGRRCP